MWRKLGRPMAAEIPAWPRYLLLLQLLWVYFSGGHNKTGLEWGPLGGFTALGNVLSDPHFARFDPSWVSVLYPITRAGTAATMVFELGAPLMLLLTYYAATADRPGRVRRWCNRWRLVRCRQCRNSKNRSLKSLTESLERRRRKRITRRTCWR